MTSQPTSPEDLAARHAIADEQLRGVMALVDDPAAWDRPSPCEGWSARDVVGHMIDTQRSFLAERAGLESDPGIDDQLQADPTAAWDLHVEAVRPIVSDPSRMSEPFDGYFGPTTVGDTFANFYIFDMVVHRWDLATALGAPTGLSEDELDLIEARAAALGDAIYMDGVCQSGVEPAVDADRETRVLAMLGRTPA